MKKNCLIICCLLVLCSCTKNQDDLFDKSPSERIKKNIRQLKSLLTDAPSGWMLTYYPKVDRNAYSDIKANLYTDPLALLRLREQEGFGHGGYIFFIKFKEDNTLEMRSDFNLAEGISTSSYTISHNSAIQLSFITKAPIHNLAVKGFDGSPDFLVKEAGLQKIVLKTSKNIGTEKEYIVLEKLKQGTSWDTYFEKVAQNKLELEKMGNPVLIIRDDQGETVFRSNYYLTFMNKPSLINTYRRYILFIEDESPVTILPSYLRGVGSGYSFTDTGLEFKNGFTYDKNTVFRTFLRKSPKKYVSIVNGFTAEII